MPKITLKIFLTFAIVSVLCILAMSSLVDVDKSQEEKTPETEAELKASFDRFVAKFRRKYDSNSVTLDKYEIFKHNTAKANLLNQLDQWAHYSAEDSPFGDWTEVEFHNVMLPNRMSPDSDRINKVHHSQLATTTKPEDLPSSFDWRDKDAVSDVKNQGYCGSCWAFSATGNIESQMYLKTGKMVSLSEQQIIECDPLDCGCYGGYPSNAFEWAITAGGLTTETRYPYCESPFGSCFICLANQSCNATGHHTYFCNKTCNTNNPTAAKLSSWATIAQNEDTIAAALIEKGPLSVAMNADWLQFYHHGVSNPWYCPADELNHAILLVGFGVSAKGKPYWIVKNSWGSDWGEKGFFQLARGTNKCGIASLVTTAVL